MYPYQHYFPNNLNSFVNRFPMYSMNGNYVPVWNLNTPDGGLQGPPMTISPTTPVYSSYTSKLIGFGSLETGIPTDAPEDHPNYNKNFHVVVYNPVNDSYMAHGQKRQ